MIKMIEIGDAGTIMRTSIKIFRSIFVFSLLFGVFFVPMQRVEAGFFSSLPSLFGGEVSADSVANTVKITPISNNSQNLSLLQADVSPISILQDKNDKNIKKDDEIDTSIDINIISNNAILPATGPMGVSDGKEISPFSLDETSVYVVRKGDSISQIATMFGVSSNTIRWANDIKIGEKLKEGDVLIILPVSGIMHVVVKGQTLKSIAKLYKVEVSDITDFNDITDGIKLLAGDELIIPDAELFIDSPINTSSKNNNIPKVSLKSLAGYYINPVPGYIKTQGLHGKNAVDLAASIGTPIYASAGGTVLLARMGWNGAYGNMIIIQHPNGTKTLYSHLFKLDSFTGQNVSRGDLIGYVGNSGRVRATRGGNGAHLHFEVHGAKNPGLDGSWAR